MAPIMVRATKPGNYGGRRRVGAVFPIASERDLGSWMVRVDEPAPAPEQTPEPEPATKSAKASKAVI